MKPKEKDKSIPRWLIKNLNDEKAVELGYYYDAAYPLHVISFIETLIVHPKFRSKPFILERWQKELIHRIYGWRRPNGKRRFNTVWFEIGRGNGKSKLALSLGKYHLMADGVSSAEVYFYASNAKFGAELFEEAISTIKASEALSTLLERPLKNEIRYIDPDTNTVSKFTVCNAEGTNSHGKNPTCVIVDEVWTLKDGKVIEALTTGDNKRGVEDTESMLFYTTTAGYPNTIYEELHDYAVGVENGTIEDLHYLPAIYAVPKTLDWKNPRYWSRANPNLGITISLEKMKEKLAIALVSPSFQSSFKQLYLNQIIQKEDHWIDLVQWDLCKGDIPADKTGFRTYLGADLSENDDVTALVLVHYDPRTDSVYVEPHFYLPSEVALDPGKQHHQRYLGYINDSNLHLIPGKTIDLDFILKEIFRFNGIYNLREVALDPFRADLLSVYLTQQGIKNLKFIQHPGWYTTPCLELQKAITNKKIVHDGNPCLRWMADNAILEKDVSGRCMPSKKKSKDKIDGLVAMTMGFDRVLRNKSEREEEAAPSLGVIFIDV